MTLRVTSQHIARGMTLRVTSQHITRGMTLRVTSQTHNARQADFQVNFVTHGVFLFFVQFEQHTCPLAFAFQPGVTPVRAGHYESESEGGEESEDGDVEESDSEGSVVANKLGYVS